MSNRSEVLERHRILLPVFLHFAWSKKHSVFWQRDTGAVEGSGRNLGRVQQSNAASGIFQSELFRHCRDGATNKSETSCKSYPCKKKS